MTDTAHHHTSPAEQIVRMANQIATAFRHLPETEAVVHIREHIEQFWTRRMREHLADLVHRHDIHPVVRQAVAA